MLYVRRRLEGGFYFLASVRNEWDLDRWWSIMVRDDQGLEGFAV